jgi:hypothetical protein
MHDPPRHEKDKSMSLETRPEANDRTAPLAVLDHSQHLLDSARPAVADVKASTAPTDAKTGIAPVAGEHAPPSFDTNKLYTQAQTQPADKERALVEKAVQGKVDDDARGVPLQRGEGYYQMLHRMHPDWNGKHTAQEAHHIKQLNGGKDQLKVGDVLQLYSPQEKTARLKSKMEAFDKAEPKEKLKAIAEAAKPELEKSLPAADKIAAAEKAAGLTIKAGDLREGLVKHAQHDIENGSLKAADITKFPRVGGAFVASGAVTEAEMDKALAHQKELGAAAKDGAKPPRIGAVLEEMYKDNPEKLGKIQGASKFYDELQKLMVEKK